MRDGQSQFEDSTTSTWSTFRVHLVKPALMEVSPVLMWEEGGGKCVCVVYVYELLTDEHILSPLFGSSAVQLSQNHVRVHSSRPCWRTSWFQGSETLTATFIAKLKNCAWINGVYFCPGCPLSLDLMNHIPNLWVLKSSSPSQP